MLDGISLQVPDGRVRRADGAVRLGQDDAPQPDRGHRPRRRPASVIVAGTDVGVAVRRRARHVAQPQRRLHLPVLQPDPGADGGGERGAAAAADQAVEVAAPRARAARAEGRRPGRSREALPASALGRTGTARRHRARHRHRPVGAGRRRADGRPRREERRGNPRPAARRSTRDFKKTIVMVTHDPRAAERAHVAASPRKGRADGLAQIAARESRPVSLER